MIWQVLKDLAYHDIRRGLMDEKYAFVMMIKDKWWREFIRLHHEGEQDQSYVQRGLAPPKNASMLFFYVIKPVAEIAGYAEFVERKVGEAEELWKAYGHESVLGSAKQYFEFLAGRQQVSFVRFKNLKEAANPISRKSILMLLGKSMLSRKGFYINKKVADTLVAIMT